MKFYSKLIPAIARDIAQVLMDNKDIEVEPDLVEEAREDFASIMREFKRQDDALVDEAKTLLIRRDWPYSKFSMARRMVAAQRKFPLGDDGVDYVINQMLEFMLISKNIEEVFSPDNVLRKRIVTILRKHMDIDEEVDREVRARLKHLQEGTSDWEIQYKQVLEQVRRNKGLI